MSRILLHSLIIALASCTTAARALVDQVSNFTLTSLHSENLSLSYTIKIKPIPQIPPHENNQGN